MTQAARRAAEVSDRNVQDFTAGSFKARAYPVMTTVVSEGFFASVMAVVEGMTETGALGALSEILNLDWKRKNVVIIPAGGKGSIDRPVIIFGGLKIPTYFVFDGDISKRGSDKEAEHVVQNATCLRLAGTPVVEFPPLTVAGSWACFEDNFEAYCRSVLGDAEFGGRRQAVADEYGYERPSDALKNFDAAGAFIKRVYRDGKRLPVLEEIARAISALSPVV